VGDDPLEAAVFLLEHRWSRPIDHPFHGCRFCAGFTEALDVTVEKGDI